MAKKDIVKEALDQVENLKEASMANAKNVLVAAMSTDLKAAVTQALHENLNEDSDQPADYHVDKKDKNLGSDRVGDEIAAQGDTPNDDPAEKGDGPAIIETGIEEDEDLEELPFDDGEEEEEEVEEMDMFEDDDFDFEDDDDEEEDVIEVVEDEEMDFADDEEEVEEAAPAAQYESTIKKLTAENKRMKNALGKVKVQMDEINLFNARLAAASDLMRRVTMTKDQKERVVENMDRCRSIGEVKRAHRMIFEGYKTKKVVKKNRVARPNLQSVVTEEAGDINNKFARINELAGL
jgi:hypothetical protein